MGRDDDGLLGWSDDRESGIGEGADTRQAALRGTGHRSAGEHEGEGKEDAEGSHLTVPFRHRRWPPFVLESW